VAADSTSEMKPLEMEDEEPLEQEIPRCGVNPSVIDSGGACHNGLESFVVEALKHYIPFSAHHHDNQILGG
jgi:hypothetical protein